MKRKFVDTESVIEHAEVNCESKDFIRNLTDYLEEEDYIEIVFCKDCRHLKEIGYHANCRGYLMCGESGQHVDFEDFCSKGEEA